MRFLDPVECCYCQGDMLVIGILGDLIWARCRHCGVTLSYTRRHWELLTEEEG